MGEIIRIIALRNMYKNTAQMEKMAAIENVADPKIIAEGKIMADVKIKADPKILTDVEIPAAREKQADGNILAGVEISAPGGHRKSRGIRKAYCLGSSESPAADFSPVRLMSSRSDPRRCDESRTQSPSEE